MTNMLQSEKGSVVLLAMLVLMLITVFGISALNTSNTELLVTYNGRCYKQNLYQAEGVVREASSIINAMSTDDLKPSSATAPSWIDNAYQTDPAFNPEDLAANQWDTSSNASGSNIYANTGMFSVRYLGPAPGESLSATAPTKLYEYAIYGKSSLCTGEVGVVAGYRQRF